MIRVARDGSSVVLHITGPGGKLWRLRMTPRAALLLAARIACAADEESEGLVGGAEKVWNGVSELRKATETIRGFVRALGG
jgi:hypothetical protein